MPPITINFGKHKGKDARRVLLQAPDYFLWCEAQPSGAARGLAARMRKLVDTLDARAFAAKCMSCGSPATRFSMYSSMSGASRDFYMWCEECSPYSSGAVSGRLTLGRVFDDLAMFASSNNMGRTDIRSMVRRYASSKGVPARLTAASLDEVFP